MRALLVMGVALLVGGGCDVVFGVPPVPDAQPNQLQCSTREAVLCADFEAGTTFYANDSARDIPPATTNQTATVDAPGVHGGHALYITSNGPTYRLEAQSPANASKITATFEIQLSQFEAATPATSLAVLFFDNTAAAQCYVALDFQPTPIRLTVVANCGAAQSADLVAPLPAHTDFVPVTFTMDLVAKVGTVVLTTSSAMAPVSVPITPGVATAVPAAEFGFIDPVTGSTAGVAFDDLLVTTQ